MVAVTTRSSHSACAGSVCQAVAPLSDLLFLVPVYFFWKHLGDVVKPGLCCRRPTSPLLFPPKTENMQAASPQHHSVKGLASFPSSERATSELFVFLIFIRAVQVAGAAHQGGARGEPPQDAAAQPAGQGRRSRALRRDCAGGHAGTRSLPVSLA